ncbi:MAG TPA: hypothetical protein VGP72_12270 [Planctomycetota bacterium]|jgi:hypothetical protein
MRTFLFLLQLLAVQALAGEANSAAVQPDEAQWHQIARGTLSTVHVDRTLFKRDGSTDFLIHVRVTNLTEKPLGVDLRDFWGVIYPNQFGFKQEKARGVIDERHMIHKPLTDEQKASLVEDFKAGKLASIPAHGSAAYFRRFNRDGSLEMAEKNEGKYLFISLDGVQVLTDGVAVEQISCAWESNDTHAKNGTNTELFISTPVKWERVPTDGRIIRDRSNQ